MHVSRSRSPRCPFIYLHECERVTKHASFFRFRVRCSRCQVLSPHRCLCSQPCPRWDHLGPRVTRPLPSGGAQCEEVPFSVDASADAHSSGTGTGTGAVLASVVDASAEDTQRQNLQVARELMVERHTSPSPRKHRKHSTIIVLELSLDQYSTMWSAILYQ